MQTIIFSELLHYVLQIICVFIQISEFFWENDINLVVQWFGLEAIGINAEYYMLSSSIIQFTPGFELWNQCPLYFIFYLVLV